MTRLNLVADLKGLPVRVKGMTLDAVRAFAEAAREFHAARPWSLISDPDVIEVHEPVEPHMRLVSVLGSGGVECGIGFHPTLSFLESARRGEEPTSDPDPVWMVTLGSPVEFPFSDADLWEDQGLALADDDAYPLAIGVFPGPRVRRPTPERLAYMEGLLRVLAEVTEDELDAGEWSRTVETASGPMEFRLSLLAPEEGDLPDSKDLPDRRANERAIAEAGRFLATLPPGLPMEEINRHLRERLTGSIDDLPSTAATPRERAQDLAYRAFGARGRQRIKLAREALALDPDCADAWIIQAEECQDVERSVELYELALAAGRRSLPEDLLGDFPGSLWGHVEARPFLRALYGLAVMLPLVDREGEAVALLEECLAHDDSDSQGARYALVGQLLDQGRDDGALAILDRYGDDISAIWPYARALIAWQREGDTEETRTLAREAVEANRHLFDHLTGRRRLPYEPVSGWSPGEISEGEFCNDILGDVWDSARAAVAWLESAVPGELLQDEEGA